MDADSREWFDRILRATICAVAVGVSGCGPAEPGDPKDFEGPLDTSQAVSSEDAQEFPPGTVDDGTGNPVKER